MSETTTWYEIKGYGIWEVLPIQVVKQNAKSLVIREDSSWFGEDRGTRTRDVLRMMNGDQFPTRFAANVALVARYETKIKFLEAEADNYRRHLANWKKANQ